MSLSLIVLTIELSHIIFIFSFNRRRAGGGWRRCQRIGAFSSNAKAHGPPAPACRLALLYFESHRAGKCGLRPVVLRYAGWTGGRVKVVRAVDQTAGKRISCAEVPSEAELCSWSGRPARDITGHSNQGNATIRGKLRAVRRGKGF